MKPIIFIIAPLLIAFSGCEEKQKVIYEHNAWENHDIEVCGVQDPLENMDWLKNENQLWVKEYEYGVQHGYAYSYRLSVYANDTTGEKKFVIGVQNGIFGYDCSGKEVFDGGVWRGDDGRTQRVNTPDVPIDTPAETPMEDCNGCDEFFATHTFQYTIAEYINKPITNNK